MTNLNNLTDPLTRKAPRRLTHYPRRQYTRGSWRWFARELVKAIDAQQAQRGRLVQFRPRRVEPEGDSAA